MIRIQVTRRQGMPPAQPVSARFGPEGGTIGRGAGNTLVLHDPERTISRVHAQVGCRDGAWFIRDCGSNPLQLNGRVLGHGKEAPLKGGDRLLIGACELQVTPADAPVLSTMAPPARPTADDDHPWAAAPVRTGSDPLAGLSPSGASVPPPHAVDDVCERAETLGSDGPPRDAPLGLDGSTGSDPLAAPLARADAVAVDPSAAPSLAAAAGRPAPSLPPVAAPSGPATGAAGPGSPDQPGRSPRVSALPVQPADVPVLDAAVAAPAAAAGPLLAAFLQGLGPLQRPIDALTPALMQRVGELLRLATEGMLQLLQARQEPRQEARAQATVNAAQARNPLKSSASVEVALTRLLGDGGPGFRPAGAAMRDAWQDLRAHEAGAVVGLRAAPEQSIAARFRLDDLPLASRKARLWEQFVTLYAEIAREAEGEFHRLFGPAALGVHAGQVQGLKAADPPRDPHAD